MNVFQKFKTIVFALVFAISAIVFVVFMFFLVESSTEALKENMQTLADQGSLERDFLTLKGVLQDTETERNELKKYILNGQTDTVSFLSEIDTIANRLDVKLSTNELQKVQNKDAASFETLLVSFSMEGTEGSVMKMLQLFETLPHHGKILHFDTVRTIDERTGQKAMSGSIELALSIISE